MSTALGNAYGQTRNDICTMRKPLNLFTWKGDIEILEPLRTGTILRTYSTWYNAGNSKLSSMVRRLNMRNSLLPSHLDGEYRDVLTSVYRSGHNHMKMK